MPPLDNRYTTIVQPNPNNDGRVFDIKEANDHLKIFQGPPKSPSETINPGASLIDFRSNSRNITAGSRQGGFLLQVCGGGRMERVRE